MKKSQLMAQLAHVKRILVGRAASVIGIIYPKTAAAVRASSPPLVLTDAVKSLVPATPEQYADFLAEHIKAGGKITLSCDEPHSTRLAFRNP